MKGSKVLCLVLFYALSLLLISGCQKKTATQRRGVSAPAGTPVGVSTQTPTGAGR